MAEIQKLAVYDSRIVQEAPRYGVQKGGLSVSNSPFKSISNSSSQVSFNINVPSQNVFLDRELNWTAEVRLQALITVGVGAVVEANAVDAAPVISFGKNASLCAFPLHSMISTATATINDTTSVLNTSDVLNELLRMVNQKKNRLQRSTPSMLDKYGVYQESDAALNNPLNDFNSATDYDNVPNGAFYDIYFTDANGVRLTDVAGDYADAVGGGLVTRFVNGVPVVGGQNANGNAGNLKTAYTVYFTFKATEKLILSPFIFSEECGDEVGLFGVNNIQLVFNFKKPERLLRLIPQSASYAGLRTVTNVDFLGQNPFPDSTVNCLFITPSLDLRLPPKSVVPYLEYPRYVNPSPLTVINAGERLSAVAANTIVLPQVPDMLIIYAKPNRVADNAGVLQPASNSQFGDMYLPITKISLNFDNYSGLLSSHTAEQLYNISVDNGLEMDWNSWNGKVRATPFGASSNQGTRNVSGVGGFLVLRFGKDIPLQASQAPGVIGSYTLQYNVDITNASTRNVEGYTLYTLTVNSGFFETQAGSSRIIKGPLTESDVINATAGTDALTRTQLERMVGGSFWSKLGTALNKAKDILMNPAVRQAVKTIGKETPLKGVIEMAERVGYSAHPRILEGSAMTGGAQSGGRRKGNLKALM
jgi:hypothetical protein